MGTVARSQRAGRDGLIVSAKRAEVGEEKAAAVQAAAFVIAIAYCPRTSQDRAPEADALRSRRLPVARPSSHLTTCGPYVRGAFADVRTARS